MIFSDIFMTVQNMFMTFWQHIIFYEKCYIKRIFPLIYNEISFIATLKPCIRKCNLTYNIENSILNVGRDTAVIRIK